MISQFGFANSPSPSFRLRNDQYCVGRGAGALNSTHSLCRS